MHWLPGTIIFLRMLCLKCQFDNEAEVDTILLFTHTYSILNKNNDDPKPLVYAYTETSYQSPKMPTWQTLKIELR